MSGFTPLPLTHFRKALRARGLTVEALADEVERARNHVSEVLHGRRDGAEVWPRIRAVVTADEWALLLRMEHCATWNNSQVAEGADAMVWLMRRQCATCKKWEGFEPCVAEGAGTVTHGICPTCFPALMAEIAALPVREPEPSSIGSHPFLSRFNDEPAITPGARG